MEPLTEQQIRALSKDELNALIQQFYQLSLAEQIIYNRKCILNAGHKLKNCRTFLSNKYWFNIIYLEGAKTRVSPRDQYGNMNYCYLICWPIEISHDNVVVMHSPKLLGKMSNNTSPTDAKWMRLLTIKMFQTCQPKFKDYDLSNLNTKDGMLDIEEVSLLDTH